MTAMVETRALTIGYGCDALIQRNLNLKAYERDLICLIGTNGTGKSTLLRTLAGLLPPMSGHVLIQGRDITQMNNTERARAIALVLTDTVNVEHLTIRDLVAMGRFPHTDWMGRMATQDKKIIDNALKQVNLMHKAACNIMQVSDGERQRAIIAKALAQDTPLVLLDEPTAHLDLPNRIEIMMLLRRLSVGLHKCFILSTHELDLAIQMADKIWLMEDGITAGVPEDLMLNGHMQQAFQSAVFRFDESDGHCRINHLRGKLNVHLTGSGNRRQWIHCAFVRCGIGESEQAPITIEAGADKFRINGNYEVSSVEEVLEWLNKSTK